MAVDIQAGGQMFSPTDVAFIDEVSWVRGSAGEDELTLRVRMQIRRFTNPWPDLGQPMTALRIRCIGLVEPRLGPLGRGSLQVTGFDILKSGEQAGQLYEVVDYEEDRWHWFCRDIVFEMLDEPTESAST